MRQFLTWRFWFAIAGVVGLFAALALFLQSDDSNSIGPVVPRTQDRTIDLVAAVDTPQPSADFAIVDGTVRGELHLVLDKQRTMHIYAGTLGSDMCGSLATPGACSVVADLMGDAVIWFALVPTGQRNTISLPPIVSFTRSGWVRLENGWELPLSRSVSRVCDDDTRSLRDFVERFGPASTTTVDLAEGRISRVTCAAR